MLKTKVETMLSHIRITALALLALLVLIGCGKTAITVVPVMTSTDPAVSEPTATLSTPTRAPTHAPTSFRQVSGPYLGQPAPGASPSRFAPNFINGALHTTPVFMPDDSEVYWSSQESWTAQKSRIHVTELKNGFWTQPQVISFSDTLVDYRDPFISPAGDKLFFLSKGKLPNSQLPEKENIWFVQRVEDGWGEPQPLSEEVNALTIHWQVSVAANGNLYFASGPEGIEDIYISKYVNSQYAKPSKLGVTVNTDQLEMTPYIAPDESYLIFTRWVNDQSSNPRLYISYAAKNGSWGEAILIDNVDYGLCPIVSPDGKYLFFMNSPTSVFWMSTTLIEGFRTK